MLRFEKVTQSRFKSKGAIIAERILEMIRSGAYPAGSKMPAERLIAEQMGVSRPSVREAISALQIVGIIESRPGDGTYISDNLIIDDLSFRVQSLLEESDSPYEIMQARKALEIGVARLAVQLATDENIQQIKTAWDQKSEYGRKGDYTAYTQLGRELHLAIAAATKNRIIISMIERLLVFTSQPLWINMRRLYYEQDPARIEQMLAIHTDIVDSFQHRDSEKLIRSLEADFDGVLAQLYNLDNDKQ